MSRRRVATSRIKDVEDPRVRAVQAAYLHAECKLTQLEVAGALRTSQPHVSRLLKLAMENGWLEKRLVLNRAALGEQLTEALASLSDRNLVQVLASYAPQDEEVKVVDARVFPSAPALTERLGRFARAASGRVAELLADVEVVGVTWGATIENVIANLDGINVASPLRKQRVVTPLSGELLQGSEVQYSSSVLAHRLNRLLNGPTAEPSISLTAIPAFVPNQNPKMQRALLEEIRMRDNYQQVFGTAKSGGLVSRIDCVLTSIGPYEIPLGAKIFELMQATRASHEDLRTLVSGDFAGTLLAKPGLDSRLRDKVESFNACWTGITLKQFKDVALRAHKDQRKPGNVVIAAGKEKASVLLEAVRRGLVNQVIVDQALANQLLVLCGAEK